MLQDVQDVAFNCRLLTTLMTVFPVVIKNALRHPRRGLRNSN